MVAADTLTFRIWIAGDYDDAIRAVKEWCNEKGDCWSVSRTDFVYTGGMEAGICLTRINYPRFAETREALWDRSMQLAEILKAKLYQRTYTIEGPDETRYFPQDL